MGQYKLQITLKKQIGVLLRYYKRFSLEINLPFLEVYIGLTPLASGYNIFGKTGGNNE